MRVPDLSSHQLKPDIPNPYPYINDIFHLLFASLHKVSAKIINSKLNKWTSAGGPVSGQNQKGAVLFLLSE